MDEQVIDDLYNRAVSQGYPKSRQEFIKLLHSDNDVMNDMYSYVQSQGYGKSIDQFKSLVGATSTLPQQPTEVKKKGDTTGLPSGLGSSASSASAELDPKRFAELAAQQPAVQDLFKRRGTPLPSQPVVGQRRDAEGYIDPRQKLGMYPTKEEADRAMNQFVADIDASKGMVEEYDETDYFTGTFGNVLRGFDEFTGTGLGDVADDIARSVAAGYRQGDLAQASNKIIRSGNEFTEQDIENIIKKSEEVQQLGSSKEFQDYLKTYEAEGKTVWGAVKGLMENPTVFPEVMTSSIVSMATNRDAVLAGAGVLAAAFGTGAATGGTAGTFVVPGVGTAVGAGAAGLSAASSALPFAFGAASSVVETGSVFAQYLQEELGTDENGNPVKPTKENVRAILEDPEKYQKIKNDAIARGLTVGIVDAVGGKLATGVGAKILRSSAQATGRVTKAGVVKALGATTGIESTAGATGEVLGQVVIGKPIDAGNTVLEFAAEMPGGLRATLMAGLKTPTYKINGGIVSAEQMDEQINTMTPEQLAATKIVIENDYDGRKEKLQDKIVTGAIANEIREAQPDLNEPTVNAIVELQKQLNKLENNKTQIAKDKAAQIRAEIKNLKENPITPEKISNKITEIENMLSTARDGMINIYSVDGKTYNQSQLETELENLKKQLNAIQEQTTGQVPVQSGTGASQEVAQGEPQAEPQVTPQEGQAQEVISPSLQIEIDKINEERKRALEANRGGLNLPYYLGDTEGPTLGEFINQEYDAKIDEVKSRMATEPVVVAPAPTPEPEVVAPAQEGVVQIEVDGLPTEERPSLRGGITTPDGQKGYFNANTLPDGTAYLSDIQIGFDENAPRGKGFGTNAYIEIGKRLKQLGYNLESTQWDKHTSGISPQALRVWEKLTELGYAKVIGQKENKVYNRETGVEEVKTTPVYQFVEPTAVSSKTQPAPAKKKKAKAAPTPTAPVVEAATPAPTPEPTPAPTPSAQPIVITDILNDIKVSFAPENAIEVQKGTREDTRGKKFTYDAAVTSQVTDRNGTPIGTMTKRVNEDGALSFTIKNTKGQNINKGKAYPTERDARVALAEQVNRVRAKSAAQPATEPVVVAPAPETKAKDKAATKAKLAEERKAAKQAAKAKTPEVDAVIEEDANTEGVLERSLDFLKNVSKGLDKDLKTNANDVLRAIPLSTLKLAVDAAKVLVRAGMALRDAIAKVAKDYNLAVKDVEEALKIIAEREDKEAAAAMPMSADNVLYSDSDVLPKPEKKASNSSVAKLLQEVAANFWGGSIVTSQTITPEQERLITNNGTEETIRAFESSGKNAADWYSKAIETAIAVAGVIHPELASAEAASKIEAFAKEKDPVKAAQMALRMALAITSQNLNVDANTTYAEEQYDYYKKNGKFDPSREYGAKAPAISSNLKLANLLIDKLGLNAAEEFISKDFIASQLEEAFEKATGKSIKISGLRNDDVNGAAIFGPKIGQGFLQNLMGKFDPVTIDLWMRRTWGRWTGDVVGTGVTDERMATLIRAVNEGVKNKEIPKSLIPKEFFQYKPVQEKRDTGNLYWTMNDKFNERIATDLEFVDTLNKFTKELTRQANNLYKAVHDIPMTKELYDKFLSGELSYFQTANKLLAMRDAMGDKYTQYVANERANKRKPLNKAEWTASQDEKAKRTFSPTNQELSDRKPQWGNAAKNIVSDLNPIDIPSNLDRRVITRVVNNIRKNVNARGYNVTNADVQALLWYPEKDIWAKLRGENESILKLSYDDQFIKIAKERGLGKQAETVAEDIRGRRTESDVRKDERRTDGEVPSRVDEIVDIDVKTPSNAETVINFLDGIDKAIAKALRTQANDALLGIPLTAIRGMIQGIKALVETGVKLSDAINKIAKDNNITQEKLKDILNISTIQNEFNDLMTKADNLIARQRSRDVDENTILSNLDKMVRDFYKNMNLNDAQRKIMEREARAKMGAAPRKSVSIGRVIGALKDITNVTREEKLKIISRIRELSKNAAKELAKDIRAMALNGQITTAQATNIISRFANVNMLNETSVSNFVDYMAEVFANVKEKNRQSLLNDLLKLVSQKAKAAKTDSGKRRSKGLDDIGQAFFEAIKPIIRAAVNKDVDALQKIRESIDDDLINEIIIKNLNGQELTSRERILLDQSLAYDTFADVANMDIEQIQALYDQLKDARTESIARLKSKRIERAEQVKALHDEADAQIKAGYSALYNEDGTLKDNNELADDVRDIWNSFNKLKVWDGVKKLFARYDFSVATSVFDFMRKNMLHIGTLSKILDKSGTFFTDNVYRALNNMDEKNLRGYFNQREVLDAMANKIKGITKGFKEFKSKMSNEVITLDNIINTKTGKKRATIMNQDEAMRIYALYKNPIQREKLTKMGFDEATMQKIEEFIGPEGKQMVDMVVDYFSTDYYESVNKVYRKVNDVSLGYVENYFPTQTISTGVDADMIIDGNFKGIFDAETAPSLKERTDTTGDVALGAGFTSVVDNHIQTMERYKAYAEGVKRINSIFKSPSVQALLGEYGTNLSRVYKSLINFSINPNGGAKIEQSILEKVMTKFTGFALSYKLVQIPKQATSFITAFEKYNYRGQGKKRIPGVDTVMFMVDMAKVIATLPSQVKKAQQISASFKDRLEKGLEGDVYGLESGGRVFRPISKSNTIWGKIARAFKKGGAAPTVIGDVLGVMGYMINYNRNIANGMSEADALEAFNDYNATQQSRRAADKIPLQQSQNALARSFTMFGSTTFLQINKAVQGMMGIMTNLQAKKMPKAEDMRAVALNVALGNAFFVLAANMAMLIKGDKEDEEKALDRIFEALIGLNLLYQVPLIGGAVEVAVKKAKGDRSPTSDVINPYITVFNKIYKGAQEDDILKAGQPVVEIVLGTQLDQFVGLFNMLGGDFDENNIYDAVGITKSYRPGGSEPSSSDKKDVSYEDRLEKDLLEGYENKTEMKRYDPDLYEKNFGEGPEYYELTKEEKEEEKQAREEERKEKDAEYGYSKQSKGFGSRGNNSGKGFGSRSSGKKSKWGDD